MGKITDLHKWKGTKKLQQQKKDLTVVVKAMDKFNDVANLYYMYKGMHELLIRMNDLKSFYNIHLNKVERALEKDEQN